MDIVLIFNGLGNQMSQYSFFIKKKSISSSTIFITYGNDHNGFELDKVFDIKYKKTILKKILFIIFRILYFAQYHLIFKPIGGIFSLLNFKIISEAYNYDFDKEFLLPKKGINFYLGGWHHENYFISEKAQISNDFLFKTPKDSKSLDFIEKIKSTNSIAVHIRRGDYLSEANFKLFGEVCNKDYFEKAINIILKKVSVPHFFIFSNDINWCINNLAIDNVSFVDYNVGDDSWTDMYLMSICKHNIIANSTFSWWAAWLNKNPNKIIVCPKRFLNSDIESQLYPNSWIKIE